jgi:CheY-like chemotaxis protein
MHDIPFRQQRRAPTPPKVGWIAAPRLLKLDSMRADETAYAPAQHADRIARGICALPREAPQGSRDLAMRGVAACDELAHSALRILVAEDDEWNVALMIELLRRRGHDGRFVSDGRAAVAAVSAGHYDLMLLDLHMPDMDGFAVVGAIREQERINNRHLPIIAVTARASRLDRERCFAAGVDEFLPKPFEKDALWGVVHRVVAKFPQGNTIVARPASR